MNVQLQTCEFDLTPSIDAYVRSQLMYNLARFDSHVVSVDVFMRDINGPRGGPDKKVLISVRLTGRISVQVESTRDDLYAAVARAARQSRRAVRRSISRHRHMEKRALRELRQFPQL